MKEFTERDVSVKIQDKEYKIRELSLAQKIKIVGGISDFIRDIAKNAFFKKSDKGAITFNFIDEISLADLNIDKIIMNALDVLPELLALSIPEFKDWENLPESETREALVKVLEINDFKGFIINFIFSAAKIIR
ncbi:MAG: hypothetical protein IJ859_10695 [Synergistaceae bacterium]|nr:hypothetical protein [Synergistaceae bacterium]MBR2209263.1 hypothetical protein [Synergistaceae bacterium]